MTRYYISKYRVSWQATELIPFNPNMVFNKFSIYINKVLTLNKNIDEASSNTLIQIQFFSRIIPLITGNMKQVAEVEVLVLLFQHQILDYPKLTFLYKTLKAARLVIIDRVVLNPTNTKLLAANT